MTMNPETGEGFDAVPVSEQTYFDPNATDDSYPGVLGLNMKKITYWQGDVEFYTYEVVGPKFGPKYPNGSLKAGGVGVDDSVWGLQEKAPPDDDSNTGFINTVAPGGGTASGTNIFVPAKSGPNLIEQMPKHDWTPCFEVDGSPTLGDMAQRNFMDITLLGAYGGDIKFPVMPEEFGADFTHEYWTPRVVGLGEIIMPGGQSMETISWDSFFPSHYDSDYMFITPTELEDPRSLTSRIIWTMRFKMNCMLVVGGGIWNDQVVITNFNYRHKAGEIFDIYYTISMKRYRAPIVTTSPNPDAEKDRWPKDPRKPGQTGDSGSGAPVEIQDGNPAEVPVEPDKPTTPPPDHTGGRDSLIHIETTLVEEEPLNLQHVDPNIGYIDPNDPSLPDEYRHPGETLAQVMGRVNSKGPNDMQTLLALNQWVTDNHYDPYTSPLKVGSGVRYYQEGPPSAAKPTVIDQAADAAEQAAKQAVGAANDAVEAVLGAAGEGTGAIGSGLTTGPVGAGAQLGPTTTGAAGTDHTIGMPKNTPSETPRKGMPPKF